MKRLIPFLVLALVAFVLLAGGTHASVCQGTPAATAAIPSSVATTVASCTPPGAPANVEQACVAVGVINELQSGSATPITAGITVPAGAIGATNCASSAITTTASVNGQVAVTCPFILPVATAPQSVALTVFGTANTATNLLTSSIAVKCDPLF